MSRKLLQWFLPAAKICHIPAKRKQKLAQVNKWQFFDQNKPGFVKIWNFLFLSSFRIMVASKRRPVLGCHEFKKGGEPIMKKTILSLLLVIALLMTGIASAAPATQAKNERDADGNYTLPLTDTPVTLECFCATSTNFTVSTFTEEAITGNASYTKIFEDTGVSIHFIVPAAGEEVTQFNLMVASGNYPDLIIGTSSTSYPGGFDQALDDNAFFDLTPYAEEYMPNYYAAIHASEQITKEATTLTNRIPVAFYIYCPEYDERELQWWGQAIRKDILDAVGKEMPTTVEEWEDVLLAMKEYGVEVPYSMVNTTGMDSALLAAFGIRKAPYDWRGRINVYADDEGTLHYGVVEEGYKEYLTMMNRWYAEGLLDPEFMTRSWFTTADTIYSMYGNGQIGACYQLDGILPTMVATLASINPEGETLAVPAPLGPDGNLPKVSIGKLYCDNGTWWAITSACKDPLLAMNFLDYMCSPEGVVVTNYGTEGYSYELVDGVPTFTDVVLKAETGSSDGWRLNAALNLKIIGQEKYTNLQFKDPMIQEWDRVWTESVDTYSTVYDLTADEETEIAAIMNDISTYAQEQTIKAIIDADALANWDNTVQQIWNMRLADALAIYQEGYRRYNDR